MQNLKNITRHFPTPQMTNGIPIKLIEQRKWVKSSWQNNKKQTVFLFFQWYQENWRKFVLVKNKHKDFSEYLCDCEKVYRANWVKMFVELCEFSSSSSRKYQPEKIIYLNETKIFLLRFFLFSINLKSPIFRHQMEHENYEVMWSLLIHWYYVLRLNDFLSWHARRHREVIGGRKKKKNFPPFTFTVLRGWNILKWARKHAINMRGERRKDHHFRRF